MWCGYLGQSQPKALLPSHQMLVLMFLLQINHHTRGVVNLCAKYRSKCHCCCSLQCPNAQGIETGDKGKELVAVTPPALVLYIKTWKWKRTWIFGYTGNSASVLGPVRPSRLWKDSKAFQLQQAYQSYFLWICLLYCGQTVAFSSFSLVTYQLKVTHYYPGVSSSLSEN